MKVSTIMQRSVISVTPETPVKEAARLIFSLGISGIPIEDKGKMVGILTESDILKTMQPTIKDIVEDYTSSTNFEKMEQNIKSILNSPVKNIMTKKFVSVSSFSPIMKAQSTMFLNNLSRLPVLNEHGNLLGIVSQGDIFREIIKNEIPNAERERYAGFVAEYYDGMVNWKKRLDYEFPILLRKFKEHNVKRILDLGIWTGEYTINLAKEDTLQIVGADHNKEMIQMFDKKRDKLSPLQKKRVSAVLTDFSDLAKKVDSKFDAAISMGNALVYIPEPLLSLVKQLSKIIRKDGVVIFQVLNYEKLLEKKDRLESFIIKKCKTGQHEEHLFVEFFDFGKKENEILHHVIVFDRNGKNWTFKGITTVPLFFYKKTYIEKALRQNGFGDIVSAGNIGEYQGEYGQLNFQEEFRPLESDWLNIIAVKK